MGIAKTPSLHETTDANKINDFLDWYEEQDFCISIGTLLIAWAAKFYESDPEREKRISRVGAILMEEAEETL